MIIGITTRIIYEDGIKKQFVNEAYIEYVKLAGFTPLILPMLTDIDDLLNICDAFLITGGDDIHSSWYNEQPSPHLGITHIEMDKVDKYVIDYGLQKHDEAPSYYSPFSRLQSSQGLDPFPIWQKIYE